MRLLIIEQDILLCNKLCEFFKSLSLIVDATQCGEHGHYLGNVRNYDCILIDHSPLKKDACSIVKSFRKNDIHTPVIVLSALSGSHEKITLFDAGADDYLVKPFCFQELFARIRAILRRPRELQSPIIQLSGLTVDSDRHMVIFGKQKFFLTRKEFALLEYLARNHGIVIPKATLFEQVWYGEGNIFSNTIEAHILNIRKKMHLEKGKLIHTIPGRGYKLETTKT